MPTYISVWVVPSIMFEVLPHLFTMIAQYAPRIVHTISGKCCNSIGFYSQKNVNWELWPDRYRNPRGSLSNTLFSLRCSQKQLTIVFTLPLHLGLWSPSTPSISSIVAYIQNLDIQRVKIMVVQTLPNFKLVNLLVQNFK